MVKVDPAPVVRVGRGLSLVDANRGGSGVGAAVIGLDCGRIFVCRRAAATLRRGRCGGLRVVAATSYHVVVIGRICPGLSRKCHGDSRRQ
ncbi:hypothetical protein D3C86_2043010 [compost metagenome]